MNNIYTPEFIKSAAHPVIQAMIEPEVGMCVILRSDRKPSVIVKTSKRYFDAKMRDGSTLLGADKQESILLPTLSWLVRKLDSMGVRFRLFADGFPVKNGTWQCDFYFFDTRSFTIGDTPELACLKALCKIKGIEVSK